ncbi:UbiH/UbiF/VisC/COQ6 family ubiquinone biosynthesis hydroxylase [Thalassotalea fusca]
MQKFDVLIVGGGMVGLSLALAIRKQTTLSVAVVDKSEPSPLANEPELRVSAINAVSQQLFSALDVWPLIQAQRSQPYTAMHVWDKDGIGQIGFSTSDIPSSLHASALGSIIENSVIRTALWQKAANVSGITLITGDKITNISHSDNESFVSFTSQPPALAKLIVGADGANSWVREQTQITHTFRDYDHHAIVATVECKLGHQDTAWQVFLPTGPLAFLPLYQNNACSIVWSTAPEEAKRLCALSPEEFGKELTMQSDGKLGNVTLASERLTFPLRMRMAHQFVEGRVVLVGDAAHTIHPLAGQGVNLGLLDAAALAETLAQAQEKYGDSWCNVKSLRAFERWRKADAVEMIAAMEAIKQTFTPQLSLVKLMRGIGMSLLNKATPIKSIMLKQAMGDKGKLPELMQANRTV